MISIEDKLRVERLEQYVDFATKRAKRLAGVVDLLDHPGWAALKEELEVSAKNEEDQNRMDEERPTAETFDPTAFAIKIKQRAATALAYRAVIANVERGRDKIAALNEDIAKARKALRVTEEGEEPRMTPSRRTIA